MEDYRLLYQNYLDIAPFEFDFSYRKNSTIGCGGEASIAFYPRTIDEAVSLLSALDQDGRDYHVLGCLSNVLPPDGKSPVAVVSMRRLSGVNVDKELFALAGTTTGEFLKACKNNSLSGAEFLVGIPCTIGGAAYMNAGAADRYMDSVLKSVLFYKDGAVKECSKEDCRYAYKHSVFMDLGGVILGAKFALTPASVAEIEERLAFFKDRRKNLPKGRSMGCVFKNPDGDFAGRLIEEAGLKGARIGGAFVSEKHANFILHESEDSQDVKDLICLIKEKTYLKFGIRLEEEIRYLD